MFSSTIFPAVVMNILRFHPVYQPRLWGGQRLRTVLGRVLPDEVNTYGESWDICDRTDVDSVVSEGIWEGWTLHRLWTERKSDLFGEGYETYERFPLICKILDACQDLSVQVHPPNRTAAEEGDEMKTEIWYVLHADPDSRMYTGVSPTLKTNELRNRAENGTLEECLFSCHKKVGEHVFIPSGLIHALGAGYIVAEIQQNSDSTYRIFDWNRTDEHGKSRELHLDQAEKSLQEFRTICAENPSYCSDTKAFTIEHHELRCGESFVPSDSRHFALIAILSGSVTSNNSIFGRGDFLLMPVDSDPIFGGSEGAQLLEICVPV